MIRTLLIFLSTISVAIGQQVDTLIINDAKFPLIKTKIFYDRSPGLDLTLPSEFKAATKTFTLQYKCIDSWNYESSFDNSGYSSIIVFGRDTCSTCQPGAITFNNFSSEISPSYIIDGSVTPYIKSGKNKYYFNSCKLIQVQNDTLTNCLVDGGNINLEFSNKFASKTNYYFLKNVTYRKGNSTFVLHHTFLIRRPNKP